MHATASVIIGAVVAIRRRDAADLFALYSLHVTAVRGVEGHDVAVCCLVHLFHNINFAIRGPVRDIR